MFSSGYVQFYMSCLNITSLIYIYNLLQLKTSVLQLHYHTTELSAAGLFPLKLPFVLGVSIYHSCTLHYILVACNYLLVECKYMFYQYI